MKTPVLSRSTVRPHIPILILVLLTLISVPNGLSVFGATAACIAPSFKSLPGFRSGQNPTFVAVGDFNRDGKLDLAVADYGTRSIRIFLGNGDGTFPPGANYAFNYNPSSITVGDFNKDGKPDLAVTVDDRTNTNPGNVSILMGNGDGTFQVTASYVVGIGPTSVAVGDFNDDSKADLAVANSIGDVVGNEGIGNKLSILLGNGDGTFQSPLKFSANSSPASIVVADFNGDGKADLGVAGAFSAVAFLGNGDGTFQSPFSIDSNSGYSLAAGDFNGDGKMDLVVTNYTDSVSVLLGNGNGTFQPQVKYPIGSPFPLPYPSSVAIGDFNGDGIPDLVVGSSFNLGSLSFLLGNGDGTFQPGINHPSSSNVTVGDFNNDGKPDIAVAQFGSHTDPGNISIMLNSCGTCLPIAISPTILSNGFVGRAYPHPTIVASGAGGPSQYEFSITGGSLPPGLTLQTLGAESSIFGAPTTTGTFSFTITARDLNTCTGSQSYSINVGAFVGGDLSVSLPLPQGGSKTDTTIGQVGPVQAGYAAANVVSGSAPYGVAVFSLTQNGVVVSEAGVSVSPPTTAARLFIDYRTGVSTKTGQSEVGAIDINTGVAIVNTSKALASIFFLLRDMNGQELSNGGALLPPGAHRAKFINQLIDLAPFFILPPNFATAVQFASLEITSDQPLSIIALRLTTNQRGETLLTTVPIADLTKSPPTGTTYFPQFADGGGYKSTFVLMNTSTSIQTGGIFFNGDDGAPLIVHQANGASSSPFQYRIQPNGVYVIQTDGSPQVVNAGAVQVIPDANISAPVGAGIFSLTQGKILVSETGVPSATPTLHARIYIDQSAGHDTGLAIAYVNSTASKTGRGDIISPDSDLHVAVNAFQADGVTPMGVSLGVPVIPPKGHAAKFVRELIAALPEGFTGVLDIASTEGVLVGPRPFVALTLRSFTNSRGDFLLTTFPIADFDQPAPAPIIFPQIADGGGYQTQFIMLNTSGSPSSTTLNLFGEDGSSLAVGKTGK